MTAESSFVETLADRRDDLRYRVGRVGMSLAEVATGAHYAAWPTAPSPDFLDAAERVIEHPAGEIRDCPEGQP